MWRRVVPWRAVKTKDVMEGGEGGSHCGQPNNEVDRGWGSRVGGLLEKRRKPASVMEQSRVETREG